MRRLPLLLLAMAIVGAGPGRLRGSRPKVVLRAPFTTSGPLFDCPPSSAACVRWNGSTIVDDIGNSWTMQGTVPQVAANVSPFAPGTAGAGPYALANNYTLGSGADVLDFAGDFTCHVLMHVNTCAGGTFPVFLSDGTNATAGWLIFFDNCTVAKLRFADGSNHDISTSNGLTVPGVNVVSFGRSGSTGLVKMNLDTIGSGAAGTIILDSSTPAKIGYSPAGQALDGTVISAVCTTETPSDALFTRVQKRALTQIGSFGEPLTVVRASGGFYDQNSRIWNVPPQVARVASSGLLSEKASTNTAIRSDAFDNAAWTKTNATATPDTQVGPGGLQTADTLTATGAGGHIDSTNVVASASVYTASVYAWTTAGTQAFQLTIFDATAVSTICTASPTATTTITRYSCTLGSAATASNNLQLRILPGAAGTGTIIGLGAQLEVSGAPTTYIPTLGTSVTRAVDSITLVNPLAAGDPRWCVDATVLPYGGRAWATVTDQEAWGMGASYAAANSALLYIPTSGIPAFEVYDSGGTIRKRVADGAISAASHRLTACDDGGTLSLYVDGTLQSSAATGAGSGIVTTYPATVRLGGGAMKSSFDGYVKSFAVSRSADKAVF